MVAISELSRRIFDPERIVDSGLLPDAVLRPAIRHLIGGRLSEIREGGVEAQQARQEALMVQLSEGPLAVHSEDANAQHYEVPAAYYEAVLGPALKYSGSVFPAARSSLAEAEQHTLDLYCERAQLQDGQRILELGCGWGSLSLHMAARYPKSRVLSVSYSSSQRELILGRARKRGLDNLEVVTSDMNDFDPGERRFDRVVSIEMFEHMRNYRLLLARIASWLDPGGRLFVQTFCHRELAYLFEDEGADDWMARQFFSGGTMPSARMLWWFQAHLRIEAQWQVSGLHYHRTLEAWLQTHRERRAEVQRIFAETYGGSEAARRQFARWECFYLACSELFAWDDGNEWFVVHQRFGKP